MNGKLLVSLLFISSVLTSSLVAEISEVEKYQAKKRAKKNNCYVYIEINGNDEWEEKKSQLNTRINDDSPFCNKITIIKSIKNVTVDNCETTSWDDIYELNIGVIIDENPGVDIVSKTEVENSTINCGYMPSETNIGIHVKDGDSMSDYDNEVDISDSHIGTGEIVDAVAKKAKDFMDGD